MDDKLFSLSQEIEDLEPEITIPTPENAKNDILKALISSKQLEKMQSHHIKELTVQILNALNQDTVDFKEL